MLRVYPASTLTTAGRRKPVYGEHIAFEWLAGGENLSRHWLTGATHTMAYQSWENLKKRSCARTWVMFRHAVSSQNCSRACLLICHRDSKSSSRFWTHGRCKAHKTHCALAVTWHNSLRHCCMKLSLDFPLLMTRTVALLSQYTFSFALPNWWPHPSKYSSIDRYPFWYCSTVVSGTGSVSLYMV